MAQLNKTNTEKIDPSVSIVNIDKSNSGFKIFSSHETDLLLSGDTLAKYSFKLFENIFGISVGIGNVLPIILLFNFGY